MVRQDIVAGLKLATEKGESLMQAMISFYNAGYKENEIEEAAQSIQQNQPQIYQSAPAIQQTQQSGIVQQTASGQTITPQKILPTNTLQNVSSYGIKKTTSKTTIIVLGAVLLVLLILLASLFIFKDKILGLFG